MQGDVWVGGAWVAGEGEPFAKTCPATGAEVWRGRAASAAQVQGALAAARAAFAGWAATPVGERIAVCERYAAGLKARREAIAQTICREMGKALWEGLAEADAMVGKIAISVAALKDRAGEREDATAFGQARLTHRPHGVMAVFGPFNFPGHLPNGHIVPALLAGNTVVFKPSELAPGVASLMAQALEVAGLPAGVVNIVQGGRETGAALLEGDINGLLFTGSAATGTFFHRHFAGRPEVILALEMGGNNPLIVWEPCDVEAAADIAAQSGYLTTGQRCSDARRLILPEGVFGDAVVEALVARARGLRIGAWDAGEVFMGPLVSERAARAALAFQDHLLGLGARAILPLSAKGEGTGFVTPGVLDVTGVAGVPDEELFGPLLQVTRVRDFDAAIAVANATRFGLAGGLVCDDDALWVRASREVRAGILNRNRPTAGAASNMPFGGPGLSGNLRPGAYYAADYSAWPQASQIAARAQRMSAPGFG